MCLPSDCVVAASFPRATHSLFLAHLVAAPHPTGRLRRGPGLSFLRLRHEQWYCRAQRVVPGIGSKDLDDYYMRQCVKLARKTVGHTTWFTYEYKHAFFSFLHLRQKVGMQLTACCCSLNSLSLEQHVPCK